MPKFGILGIFVRSFVGVCIAFASGCGYSMQNSHSPLKEEFGISKIYVEPLVNDTYKPGIENVVYNNLLRTINSGKRVTIVGRKEEADAVLSGNVVAATSTPGATVPADRLKPVDTGPKNLFVAVEYSAALSVSFRLTRVDGKKEVIWSAGFGRSKTYPGNNQLGVRGTTSQLINESEFDRSLADMAEQMMWEVHESMLARF